ncbi:MAG TPA: FadR/GntR family transcriptional regulator [Thermomicrobiales bacterium]|nr:FadR/GntR family transcriptional regulator [Thermomicrobiales bacterium]
MSKRSPSFAMRPRPDLSQQLSHQIVELIAASELAPGDRLPTMKDLAQRFNVATPTMREALRLLQATGMIDIRHGSGIYLLRREQGMMIANPHRGDLDAKAILDLLEARLLIEPYLAGLAATRVAPGDVSRIAAILDDAARLLEGQDLPLGAANMRFHTAIATIAGNQILALMLDSLVELYGSEQIAILELFNARRRDHQEHIGIFEAIRAGDAGEASRRMAEHLIQVRDVIAERLRDQVDAVSQRDSRAGSPAVNDSGDRPYGLS